MCNTCTIQNKMEHNHSLQVVLKLSLHKNLRKDFVLLLMVKTAALQELNGMVPLGYSITHCVHKEIWPTVQGRGTVNGLYWGRICSPWAKHWIYLERAFCLTLYYSCKLREETFVFDLLTTYFVQFALMFQSSAWCWILLRKLEKLLATSKVSSQPCLRNMS